MRTMDWIREDVRYALRGLLRRPAFAATAVVTLACGIGLNTAVFSVLDAVLLRPLPYSDPGRLMTIRQTFPKIGELALGAAPAEYLDYRDRTRVFSAMGGYEDAVFDLTGGREPVRVQAQRVTHTLFATLGVSPALGRAIDPSEDQAGGPRVAVLSYDFWQQRFGGSASVVGSRVRLDEQPYTVVGVMPRGFAFPFTSSKVGQPPALWVPMAFTPKEIEDRASEFPVRIVARLRPGVSQPEAQRDVDRVAADFQRERADIYSGNLRLEATLEPLGAEAAARARPVLVTLSGAVLFVLMIACANVTNLLLSRATVRQREIAVRGALGASAPRLVSQVLAESLVITLAGGLLGCGLAAALVRVAVFLWPSSVAGLSDIGLDGRVLAFTLAVSAVTGLLCGLAPARSGMRLNVGAILKQGGRPGGSGERHRLRHALVVVEAASAVVLLIGAGLMMRSFVEVLRVPMGFSPQGVLIARSTLNRQRYPSGERRREAQRQMAQRLAALPGVSAVGITTHIPLADERQIGFVLEGDDERSVHWADNALVTGEYFAAMGVPIRRGRTFGAEDAPQAPPAAIVNEALARRYWPDLDPIGRRLLWGGRTLTVVGVAGDVRLKALDAAVTPTIYTPLLQIESGATTNAVFILRTGAADPAALAPMVRPAVWSVDPEVPVFDVRGMSEIVAGSLATRSFALAVLGTFAALALFLAVGGLYGVLSYTVAQRTAEIGIRSALGATPGQVLRMVLGDGLRLALGGLALGLVAGALVAQSMSRLLFGIHSLDVTTFTGAAVLLVGVATMASWLPARRASRVDPMAALRFE
jgi:putative ABC transport system permease protein